MYIFQGILQKYHEYLVCFCCENSGRKYEIFQFYQSLLIVQSDKR